MAVEAAAGPMKGKLVVRNIGLLLSGDLGQPILDADTIVAVDGRITAIGKAKDVDTDKPDLVIDAKGCAVAPGPDRQPLPSCVRRLDAATEPARLDRLVRQRRRHYVRIRGRGAPAGPAQGPHRRQGSRDHGAAHVCQLPPFRSQSDGRRSGAGENDGRGGLRGTRPRRRHHDRRDRARHGEHGTGSEEARRLVPQARHPDHHSHRRSVHSGLQPDQPRGGAGGRSRRRSATSTAATRRSRPATSASCASRPRAPSRSCTTATKRRPSLR